MERDYKDGVRTDVIFFVGTEIEMTPAQGMKTLFVVGVQPVETIEYHAKANNVQHIYLGANQSFDPGNWQTGDAKQSHDWNLMITDVLKLGYMTTLDFDVRHVEWVAEGGYSENDLFIPQISVKIPYLQLLGYNAMLKIDDKDFKATNPGVWCHELRDLLSRDKFTPWNRYKGDRPI